VILAATWFAVYRQNRLGLVADAAIVAAICLFTLAVDQRWDTDVIALITAAVFFGRCTGRARGCSFEPQSSPRFCSARAGATRRR